MTEAGEPSERDRGKTGTRKVNWFKAIGKYPFNQCADRAIAIAIAIAIVAVGGEFRHTCRPLNITLRH
ncbi:hypothetical protein D9M70_559590 [compost metagenome]